MPPPTPAVAAIRQKAQYGVVGSLHGVREQQRRHQQQRGAGDRPVAPAELRHRERVGQPQQRADQVGERDQQEQLLRRELEALREQERRRDAPDQPDREAEVLGEDRPDQVAAGDRAAASAPRTSASSGRQSSIQRRVRRGVGVLMPTSVGSRCVTGPAAPVAESSTSPHDLTRPGRHTSGPGPLVPSRTRSKGAQSQREQVQTWDRGLGSVLGRGSAR